METDPTVTTARHRDPDDRRLVTFGYRGVTYQVELNSQDRQALTELLAHYATLATPVKDSSLDATPPR